MSQQWMIGGNEDPIALYRAAMMGRAAGGPMRRFDEYYRCYPVAMMPGPERSQANHGGKVFMPASALEKLTRLQIVYPMLFELINGAKERMTHAGVLEFTAEEGKIYLPYWLMQTLVLEAGDLVQIKSTDLPPGTFIKLQPQSPDFLDITDPKAVLENAFRNFSCLTVGDVFSFEYNDNIYEIAVLEVRPDGMGHAVCTLETDLSVDFAEPVGYQEFLKAQESANGGATGGNSLGRTASGKPAGGTIHTQGSMAQAINYNAIKPSSEAPAAAAAAMSSNFGGDGHRVGKRKAKAKDKAATTASGAGAALASAAPPLLGDKDRVAQARRGSGPQPLRLPPGKLFFGFEYVPPKRKAGQPGSGDAPKPTFFQGKGQNLRGKVVDSSEYESEGTRTGSDAPSSKSGGRTLRDAKKPAT